MSAVYRGAFSDASLLSQQQEALSRVRRAQEQARLVLERETSQAPTPPSSPIDGGFIPTETPVFNPNSQRPQVNNNQAGNILSQLFGSKSQNNRQNNSFNNNINNNGNATDSPNTPNRSGMPPFASGVGHSQSQSQSATGGTGATGGGRGIMDILSNLKGGSASGLGDTLRSTISSVSQPLAGIMDTFGIDGEKLIILMVMWIIFNERGDKTLLLALGYLLF